MKTVIISLIYSLAPHFNINPKLALAIAQHESKLNPKAIGTHKEVGLFQVRPEYSKYTSKQLKDPVINIKEGLRILAEAKLQCKHKADYKFIVCYNVGNVGGSRIRYPKKFYYYKQVMQEMDIIRLSKSDYVENGLNIINKRLSGDLL